MSFADRIIKFANPKFVPDGWYWLLQSKELKSGQAKPANFLAHEYVVYRGQDGIVRVLDAHCPHMGAHLCDGKVEGADIRCPFHFWKFGPSGECIDVPAHPGLKTTAKLKSYHAQEKYGLIWLWQGHGQPHLEIPVVPELQGVALDSSLGRPFVKACHPNVMMINAIDAHHFRSVHQLVVDLNMQPKTLGPECIQFSNTTPMPQKNMFLRWASRFYQKALTYELTYWWGHVGSVMVGPDFLHFYIIFALRPGPGGCAEGQTILVTRQRPGILGFIANPIILYLTKLVGNYFAKGDTLIFSRIRFRFQTPVRADAPIVQFIEHYEQIGSHSFQAELVQPVATSEIKIKNDLKDKIQNIPAFETITEQEVR